MMNRTFRVSIRIIALALALCPALPAAADATLELTNPGDAGWVSGAFFQQTSQHPTGSGVIHSFVQILSNRDETSAYNTTHNNVFDVGPSNQHNHEITLSQVPTYTFDDGTVYYQFLLDINQSAREAYLSLDEIQIFLSDTPNQSVTSFDSDGVLDLVDASLVYRLDTATQDNWIRLNYLQGSGSGGGDMFAYIPAGLFEAYSGGYDFDYVYVYSAFGHNYRNTGGFEEWALLTSTETVVPEPATLTLLGAGLLGLAVVRRKRSSD